VFDVIAEADTVDECLDNGDYDDLVKGDNGVEDEVNEDEFVDEQEDTAAKSKIISTLKDASASF